MSDYSNTRIQVRRGTAAEWATLNPVLGEGEPGYDLTNKIFKIGDGINVWGSLSGITGGGGGGGGGAELNDLTSIVTWANVPDANITESSVVQHSGALRLTESQITDLQSYLTSVSDDTAPSLGGELNLNNNDIVFDCKNSTGSQILAGTPVYVSGYYSTNGKALIAPARSDDPTKMPAIGVLNSTINDGNEGTVGIMGIVSHINTNSFEVGETVYVAPAGGLTNVKPSGELQLIQNLGRVLRKDASQGKIVLLGAGRSNDVPNSATFTGDVEANSFVKIGGTSSQFLKADGSVDLGNYVASGDNVSKLSNDVNYIVSDNSVASGSDLVTNIISLTQEEYDLITPESDIVYLISGVSPATTTYTAGDGLTLTGTEFSADLLSDTSAVANSVQITNIVAISQANYDALGSYDANTLYYIT